MEIRRIVGAMPFDSNGRHATGREYLDWNAAGTRMVWHDEYEGDATEDLPETESEADYSRRYYEYQS